MLKTARLKLSWLIMVNHGGHGGKREGAGSGGKREGAGRPRRKWDSGGRGEIWIVERQDIRTGKTTYERWTVLDIDSDNSIEFQTNDESIIRIAKSTD